MCCLLREPLLVSLLDGAVVAIDPDSGSRLWTFASGFPLVSASGATNVGKADSSDSTAVSRASRTIFPGADGALYSYRQDGEVTRGLEVRPPFHEDRDAVASMSLHAACVGMCHLLKTDLAPRMRRFINLMHGERLNDNFQRLSGIQKCYASLLKG